MNASSSGMSYGFRTLLLLKTPRILRISLVNEKHTWGCARVLRIGSNLFMFDLASSGLPAKNKSNVFL